MCPVAFPDEKGFFDLRFFKLDKRISDTHNSHVFLVKRDNFSDDVVVKFYLASNIKINIEKLMELKHENLVKIK